MSELLATATLGEGVSVTRDARLELSRRFSSGSGGLEQNSRAALRLYNTAAKQGYPGVAALSLRHSPVVRAARPVPQAPSAQPPVAIVSANPLQGAAPLHAQADALQSTSFNDQLWYGWVLPEDVEGSPAVAGGEVAVTGDAAVDYLYYREGVREAWLVVMDAEGRMDVQPFAVDVTAPTNAPAAATPGSPADQQSHLHFEPLQFTWAASTTATDYRVLVANSLGDVLIDSGLLFAGSHCEQGICEFQPGRGLAEFGAYTWQIAAVNTVGSTSSETRTLSVTLPAATPLCAIGTNDTTQKVIPYLAKPAYLQSVVDPAFGSTITRVTNSANGYFRHLYSTVQPWNSDESLLLVYQSDSGGYGHRLLDGETYAPIKPLDIYASDIEDLFWSYHDPEVLYYFARAADQTGELIQHNVITGAEQVVADFADHCPAGSRPVPGNDVQMHSHDNDVFGFRCGSGNLRTMHSYRISDGTLHTASLGDDTDWYPYHAPNPLAKAGGMLLNGEVLGLDLNPVGVSVDTGNAFEHASVGLTSTGDNALFQVSYSPSPNGCSGSGDAGIGQLVLHNLETGGCEEIVSSAAGYPYPASGTHVSATAYKQPGWAALSSIGHGQIHHLTSDNPAPALLSEIYLVNTDPVERTVCRLAHHRSFGRGAVNTANYNAYFGEPHAAMSPSGTRIIFASDWYDSGSVDAYVIDLR